MTGGPNEWPRLRTTAWHVRFVGVDPKEALRWIRSANYAVICLCVTVCATPNGNGRADGQGAAFNVVGPSNLFSSYPSNEDESPQQKT